MTRQIPLTQGKYAIVDDADYPLVSQFRWCALKRRHGRYYYAVRGNNGQYTPMHRLIVDAHDGEDVDHINGDGLDNRRCNLRKCTQAENSWNSRVNSRNTTGFRGVCPDAGKFKAYISCNGKRFWLGYHATPEEAAHVRDLAAIELHGEFARVNFQQEAPDAHA